MSSRQLFFLYMIVFSLLAGCITNQPKPEDVQTGLLSELPTTWTVEISLTPGSSQADQTKLTPIGSPSSTPEVIPPTPSQLNSGQPTQTPFSYRALPFLTSGKEINLTSIHMITSEKGWAIGSQEDAYQRILFTRDGGYNWQDKTPSILVPQGFIPRKDNIIAHFEDEKTALILIDDTRAELEDSNIVVWKTEDSGQTWSPSTPLPFPLNWYYIFPGGFSFVNPDIGWLMVQTEFSHMHDFSYLFSTRDGGANWKLINQPGNSMIEVLRNTGMVFANDTDGWVSKDEMGFDFGPFIEITHNAGLTWENLSLPHPGDGSWQDSHQSCQTINPVFSSPQTGFVLVQCFMYDDVNHQFRMEDPDTFIYATSDLGESWQITELPSRTDQLLFTDLQTGFAMGRDHYKTINGGGDWIKIKSVTWDGQFSFINPEEGWTLARRDTQVTLLHTHDGGLTYQEITPIAIP